jgi:hypothetical protein
MSKFNHITIILPIYSITIGKCVKLKNGYTSCWFFIVNLSIQKVLKNIILKWGCIFKTTTCNISCDHLNGWEQNDQNHSQPSNFPRITTFENF